MTPETVLPSMETPRETFLREVADGLNRASKSLPSKYFYDAEGDRLFTEITRCPEYYLTRCEDEILRNSAAQLAVLFARPGGAFDLVELGSGDATKSVHLLREIFTGAAQCCYYPIDISASALALLEGRLPQAVPGLRMRPLNGEYLPMVGECYRLSPRRKVLLFMGATIGNMKPQEAADFLRELRARMQPEDLLLLGFDLLKSPLKILAAYNDAAGFTRDFNLNLLTRINRELGGDFDCAQFYHYPTYDPDTGACKSYLVSARKQAVSIAAAGKVFLFEEGEHIHTEVSQKYSAAQVDVLAKKGGFVCRERFTDSGENFLVDLWEARV